MKRAVLNRWNKERGAALILVVWAVGLMSVFAASAARDSSLDNLDARLVRGEVIAKAMAEGGVRQAAQLWRDSDELALSGHILCRTETGLLRLDIAPAASRIDLNLASEGLLSALFVQLGASTADADHYADLIADYRDSDDLPRSNGGEKQAYQRAGLPYGPKNNPFDTVAEVAAIPGIPAWLYRRAYPHLTTRGKQLPDNTYAEAEILAAIEASAEIAPPVAAAPPRSRSGRIDSRSLSRPAPINQSNSQSATLRVRAAARTESGGYYVADAELTGVARSRQVPRIVRMDVGTIRPDEFVLAEGETVDACAVWTPQ